MDSWHTYCNTYWIHMEYCWIFSFSLLSDFYWYTVLVAVCSGSDSGAWSSPIKQTSFYLSPCGWLTSNICDISRNRHKDIPSVPCRPWVHPWGRQWKQTLPRMWTISVVQSWKLSSVWALPLPCCWFCCAHPCWPCSSLLAAARPVKLDIHTWETLTQSDVWGTTLWKPSPTPFISATLR